MSIILKLRARSTGKGSWAKLTEFRAHPRLMWTEIEDHGSPAHSLWVSELIVVIQDVLACNSSQGPDLLLLFLRD